MHSQPYNISKADGMAIDSKTTVTSTADAPSLFSLAQAVHVQPAATIVINEMKTW